MTEPESFCSGAKLNVTKFLKFYGKVYKGTPRSSNTQIVVKKVSHDSKQGMKEFVAEIISMGRLRHRNLVQLLGYCQ